MTEADKDWAVVGAVRVDAPGLTYVVGRQTNDTRIMDGGAMDAGEPIRDVLTAAPGNGAPIGGLKVVSEHGWFAARPSGTEDVYKVYAESFRGPDHLARVQEEARAVVSAALGQ